MKTTLKFLTYGLMALAIATTSCTKDSEVGPIGPKGDTGATGTTGPKGDVGEQGPKGDMGEQGPKGDAGADGQDGTDGTDGTDGQDGNANVLSATVTLNNGDWKWNGVNYWFHTGTASIQKFTRYVTLPIPAISEDIFNNGLVLVYLKVGQTYRPLPTIFSRPNYNIHMDYDFGIQNLTLHYFYDKTSDAPIPNLETTQITQYTFKYVIIQGNAITSKSADPSISLKQKITEDGVDLDDYLQVADYFKLED